MILMELIAHPHWFWLTLGGLLLAAEMLGTSGYLLWSGLAAVLVGLIEWFFPFSLKDGLGHVRIGDSSWRVQAKEDLPAGTPVIVTGVVGITLLIQPRFPSP